MSGFGKRIDGPRGRRSSMRSAVCIPGSAVSLEESKSVLVEDLCSTGARVFGRKLPAPGREVLLRTGDLNVLTRVAWANDDHRGLVFDCPRRVVRRK